MMLAVGRRTVSSNTEILALTAYHSGLAQLMGCLWHLSPDSKLHLTHSLQGLVVSAQPVVHTENSITWTKETTVCQ